MAKRKMNLPLALIAGVGAGLVDSYAHRGADFSNFFPNYMAVMTGYHQGQFNAEHLKRGLFPLVLGVLVHKFVGGAPLNVNRALAAAGVPILRI